MPVDLSRVGLEGIETAQRTLNSIAARESQAQQDALAMRKAELEEQDRALDQLAMQNTMSILEGRGINVNDPTATTEDFGELFDTLGTQYLKAGAPKRGKEFIEAGIDYRKKQSDIDKAEDDQEKVRLDNMITAGSWVAQNIGENESEYALFLAQLEDPENPVGGILGADNVKVLKETPWSPDLVNFFKSKAISIKDQAQLALTERGHRRQEQSLANTESYRKSLLQINQANLDERRRENARKEKVGGNKIDKAPTGDERKTAQRALVTTIKALDGVMPEDGTPEYEAVLHMTDDVVGRAKTILAENKGLTFPEAVEQAVAESEAAGDFSILEKPIESWMPFGFGDSVEKRGSYKRKGTTADNPIPLPQGDATTVRKKLVKGRFYNTPMGALKWNGTSFDQ